MLESPNHFIKYPEFKCLKCHYHCPSELISFLQVPFHLSTVGDYLDCKLWPYQNNNIFQALSHSNLAYIS